MDAIEYCPECSTYIGAGPVSRTACPECGADLADLPDLDEDDDYSLEVEADTVEADTDEAGDVGADGSEW